MPRKHTFPLIDPDQIDVQPPSSPDALLNIHEAAEFLTISASSMRRLQAERWVPFFKIGSSVRFSRKDLEAYVAKRRIDALDRGTV